MVNAERKGVKDSSHMTGRRAVARYQLERTIEFDGMLAGLVPLSDGVPKTERNSQKRRYNFLARDDDRFPV